MTDILAIERHSTASLMQSALRLRAAGSPMRPKALLTVQESVISERERFLGPSLELDRA